MGSSSMNWIIRKNSPGWKSEPMAVKQKFVTFTVNSVFFGADVNRVQEVFRRQEITGVPLAPSAVAGVINLRGQIIPAVDLRRRLGFASGQEHQQMNVVVRTAAGPVSLVVDEIGDVTDVSSDLCEMPPQTLPGAIREVTRQVYKLERRLLLELDTERVVRVSEQVHDPAGLPEKVSPVQE